MNWKEEAVERLGRYAAMKTAVQVIPVELQRLELEAASLSCGLSGGTGKKMNIRGREDMLLSLLVRRQELEKNHANASLWLQSMDKALGQLSQQDQLLLEQMYIRRDRDVTQLCVELGLEKTSLYRRRDTALKHLTLALYGALES